MSRILITGGLGYVGGRLTRYLAKKNEVWVSSRKAFSDADLRLHGDIRFISHQDLFSVEGFPENIDAVIHLAALNERDSAAFPDEAALVNVEQTRRILASSIARNVKTFLYFSTAHVYRSPLIGFIGEETEPKPAHPYAITHLEAEKLVIAAAKDLRVVVVRLSNAFGAPVLPSVNRWTLLANDLCRQAVGQGNLRLQSNGCQYRDFVCLRDVERIVAGLLDRPGLHHRIYNLGSGSGIRVLDMANFISAIAARLFSAPVPVVLPAGSLPTSEPSLEYSIRRLVAEGFSVENDVTSELEGLLMFCKTNFG